MPAFLQKILALLMVLCNGILGLFCPQAGLRDYHVYVSEGASPPVVSVSGRKIQVQTDDCKFSFYTSFALKGAHIVQAERIPDCAVIYVSNRMKSEIRVRFVPEDGGRPADQNAAAWDGDRLGPERPYMHDYSQTLTMKFFMAGVDQNNPDNSLVNLRFDEALEKIREIDALTLGIPKIVYLVGWSGMGLDDKYPAIDVVNPFLACPGSTDAKGDLRWLMREARSYNTAVSLHINSTDIYKDSPDWDIYRKNGLVGTRNGNEVVTGSWNGRNAYHIVYKNVWESGFYKKWGDDLLAMLPELREAGTIHSDAFGCRAGDQATIEQEWAARRQMIRYWRDCGLDLTVECMVSGQFGQGWEAPNGNSTAPTGLVGLVPYAWHLWQDAQLWHSRPAALLAGGGAAHTERFDWTDLNRGDDAISFLYGRSMQGEDLIGRTTDWDKFIAQFCTTTLLYTYQNRFANVSIHGQGDERVLVKEGGLVARYSDRTLIKAGVLLRQSDDVFAPASWLGYPAVMAYSKEGYDDRAWTFLPEWDGIHMADIYAVTTDGPQLIEGGITVSPLRAIDLTIAPGQAILIVPAGHIF